MIKGKYVSRGGEKLEAALERFSIEYKDKTVADFGSSTGGFVDCLLQHEVRRVYSVDTSYGELDWKLRNDNRVVVMERTNAMHVDLPEKMDLITIDTGWTKQEHVLPNAFLNLKEGGSIISLIKPHYEAKDHLIHAGKLEAGSYDEVIAKVRADIERIGGKILQIIESPIEGARAGNREYLAWIKRV